VAMARTGGRWHRLAGQGGVVCLWGACGGGGQDGGGRRCAVCVEVHAGGGELVAADRSSGRCSRSMVQEVIGARTGPEKASDRQFRVGVGRSSAARAADMAVAFLGAASS
jgi:hypothetical protein